MYVVHVLLQNKVRNKAIACCVVNLFYKELINLSKSTLYSYTTGTSALPDINARA